MSAESETFAVKRRKKYLTGHSYATGIGYSFSWADDSRSARQLEESTALFLAVVSGGKVVELPPLPKPFC